MATATTAATPPHSDPPPPKSKTQPYYSTLPSWSDITPIPQADLDDPSTYTSTSKPPSTFTGTEATRLATAGPALATIAYAPRYAEAMSYLRAVMAENEFSARALALTEDIIGMNPAHYTVWIYRLRCLRRLWGVDSGGGGGEEEKRRVVDGVEEELRWLEAVSERNLKNYQIWHHRTSLVTLLPHLPENELSFLTHILSFDTKNYHVWSYRQWLCARFPSPLLTTDVELDAVNTMVSDDVMNNSAWNHRWFVVFGWREIQLQSQSQPPSSGQNDGGEKGTGTGTTATAKVIDLDVVDREIEYAQSRIRAAPQNGSSWNYLRGVLRYADVPVTDMKGFCAEFVGEGFDFFAAAATGQTDGDGRKAVTSSLAVEMLVDVFAVEAVEGVGTEAQREEAKRKAREGLRSLTELWDPIRRNYWRFKLRGLEEKWRV